jgi:hypothetical protein
MALVPPGCSAEPQNAVWCGQHRVLQAGWSEADTNACTDQLKE